MTIPPEKSLAILKQKACIQCGLRHEDVCRDVDGRIIRRPENGHAKLVELCPNSFQLSNLSCAHSSNLNSINQAMYTLREQYDFTIFDEFRTVLGKCKSEIGSLDSLVGQVRCADLINVPDKEEIETNVTELIERHRKCVRTMEIILHIVRSLLQQVIEDLE